ncbi:MAG TPA: class I SAM-dependent methyltransferase [Phycisphaerae bacterium]|nr:class I SAM-dependent methyltransferase [Phycisphaerae bacterium]
MGRTYDVLEKRAVERALAGPVGADRLLEVGCGTGHWSAFFSAHGFTVTGVDIAPEMIAVARAKKIANAAFQVADAHSLPFSDEEFDVTAAITTLEFVRDAQAVLREIARCTRGSGGFILAGVLNALAAINVRRKAAGDAPYSDARFFSPREVKDLLEPYGKPYIAVAAFVPSVGGALPLAPFTDFVGRLLRSQRGAFIVGRVRPGTDRVTEGIR